MPDRKPFVGPNSLRCRPAWSPPLARYLEDAEREEHGCDHRFEFQYTRFRVYSVCAKCGLERAGYRSRLQELYLRFGLPLNDSNPTHCAPYPEMAK